MISLPRIFVNIYITNKRQKERKKHNHNHHQLSAKHLTEFIHRIDYCELFCEQLITHTHTMI